MAGSWGRTEFVGNNRRIGTRTLNISLSSACRTLEIRPNISCYNRLMRLHARNRCDGQMAADGHTVGRSRCVMVRSTTAALKLLAEMRENSVKPDVPGALR